MENATMMDFINMVGSAPILIVMAYFLWRIDRRLLEIEFVTGIKALKEPKRKQP